MRGEMCTEPKKYVHSPPHATRHARTRTARESNSPELVYTATVGGAQVDPNCAIIVSRDRSVSTTVKISEEVFKAFLQIKNVTLLAMLTRKQTTEKAHFALLA